MSLARFDRLDGVVSERGEIDDAVVHVRRFVNANKRLVENGEQIPEEVKGCWL